MDSYLKKLISAPPAGAAAAVIEAVAPSTNVLPFRTAEDLASLQQDVTKAAEIRTAASVILDRIMFLRQAGITFHGARDLYEILGYSRLLTNREYRDRYHRGGLAGRIVDALPNACWRGEMEVLEDPDPKKPETKFEKEWSKLDQRLQVRAKLQRADKLTGLSTYAVVLIGSALNPVDLSQPLPKGTSTDQIIYLSPFSGGGGPGGDSNARAMALDADCTIETFDVDTSSPRFGQPNTYRLKRTDLASPMLQRAVHWTRILHLAENCIHDEVYGQPTLERVWNLLDDLDKVTGGGAEAFWLRANQGLHMNIDKDMQLPDVKGAVDALKEQSEEYKHQITRWLRTRGVDIKTLGSDVADFQSPSDAIITQIAGAKAMPKRILTGSEMGELASSQDRDNWKDQINGRQTEYLGPYVVRKLVGRLIEFGYLPTPSGGPDTYFVVWPHIQTLTEQEKAEGAKLWAGVNQVFGSTVFTAEEIRDKWYGMEAADPSDQEAFKANLAFKMAMTNKTQGVTVFTDDEIRKTCYGWAPLTPEQKVPIGAPERISVNKPPEEGEDPSALTAPAALEMFHVLERAIIEQNVDVVDKMLGLIREARTS